jgi:hypothetical protein
MIRSWTLAAVALLAVAVAGCGQSSSPPTNTRLEPAVVRFAFPDPVVAEASSDSRFAMEAYVPMVISETSGKGSAYLDDPFVVAATDEATGVLTYPIVTFTNPLRGNGLAPGRSIEAPFRVGLSATGTYRVRVTLNTWTPVPNSIYNERAQYTGEFRIIPPR